MGQAKEESTTQEENDVFKGQEEGEGRKSDLR